MADRSALPPPGIWGGQLYWPFSSGGPSLDISRNKDITTLLEDYGPIGGMLGPGEDIGPASQNIEDRRGQPYVPMSLAQMLMANLRGGHFAYPGRRYGPYDADIDASVVRQNDLYAVTPALRALANYENWFRALESRAPEEGGREPPEHIEREYRRVKKK